MSWSKNFPKWQFLYTDIDSLDITDENTIESYIQKNNPDIIVNCAAYTAVDKAESDIDTAKKVNELGSKSTCKIRKKNRC